MTDKENTLLIRDLCARLPFGVTARYYGPEERMVLEEKIEGVDVTCTEPEIAIGQYGLRLDQVKPILRPLDTMTNDERCEMCKAIQRDRIEPWGEIRQEGADNLLLCTVRQAVNLLDYLYQKGFDVRGLITIGLADKKQDKEREASYEQS